MNIMNENNNYNKENKNKSIYYDGKTLEINKDILENLSCLFKGSKFKEETKDILKKYLKDNNLNEFFNLDKDINSSFLDNITKFYSPIQLFKMQLNKGAYEENFKNMLELYHLKSVEDMLYKIHSTGIKINSNIDTFEKCMISSRLSIEKNIEDNKDIDCINNNSIYNDRYLLFNKEPKQTIDFYQCNSGYTTISSSESSEDEYEDDNDNTANNINSKYIDSNHYTSNINYDTINNKLSNIIKNTLEKNNKSEGNPFLNNNNRDYSINSINNMYSDNKLSKIDSKATSKIIKNQVTVNPRTDEEIDFYRKQEAIRYKYPHLSWIYYNLDGSQHYIVGPVLKRPPPSGVSKPRDHAMLKRDRPGYITILCLARDAASKLENFVGTRADICELIKDSSYINEKITDNQINTIVSGALDRLHYEKDPSVKYDVQKKLWIYLHGNRNLDYHGKYNNYYYYYKYLYLFIAWNEHLENLKPHQRINPSVSFQTIVDLIKNSNTNSINKNNFKSNSNYVQSSNSLTKEEKYNTTSQDNSNIIKINCGVNELSEDNNHLTMQNLSKINLNTKAKEFEDKNSNIVSKTNDKSNLLGNKRQLF